MAYWLQEHNYFWSSNFKSKLMATANHKMTTGQETLEEVIHIKVELDSNAEELNPKLSEHEEDPLSGITLQDDTIKQGLNDEDFPENNAEKMTKKSDDEENLASLKKACALRLAMKLLESSSEDDDDLLMLFTLLKDRRKRFIKKRKVS